MANGSPTTTGTLGPAVLPFGLPQDLGGAYPYITAVKNDTTASVTITANNIDGYTSITIYRIVGTGRAAIRTASNTQTGGAAQGVFMDYEAPLGVSVTYVLNADSVDVATSNAITLTYTVGTYWLKDPSNPTLNMLVNVEAMGKVSRPARILAEANVLGRANPHTVNDVRQGRVGSMVLTANTLTDQTNLINLFADGGLLFFQCPPTYGFPDMYFIAKDLDETWDGVASEPTHSWSFTFTEQNAPASTTNTNSLNSYLQVTLFGTYQNLLNKRVKYTNVLTTPWAPTDGSG